jgi:two-component system, NtrC family, sensor kinase
MSSSDLRATILVIDDSAAYRSLLKGALIPAGFDVIEAADGEQGLKLASQYRPAAMTVDGILPGIHGPAVIRRVRLDPQIRTTPCLFLTGNEDLGTEIEALESGADAFAKKTQPLALIVARISAMVRASTTTCGSMRWCRSFATTVTTSSARTTAKLRSKK